MKTQQFKAALDSTVSGVRLRCAWNLYHPLGRSLWDVPECRARGANYMSLWDVPECRARGANNMTQTQHELHVIEVSRDSDSHDYQATPTNPERPYNDPRTSR